MRIFLLVLQIIIMLAMTGVILLQQGEDAASSFSSSKRGTSGLVKITSFLAFIFFVNCIVLAHTINKESASDVAISSASNSLPGKETQE
jgi:protein translocase SecG subunit